MVILRSTCPVHQPLQEGGNAVPRAGVDQDLIQEMAGLGGQIGAVQVGPLRGGVRAGKPFGRGGQRSGDGGGGGGGVPEKKRLLRAKGAAAELVGGDLVEWKGGDGDGRGRGDGAVGPSGW